MRSNLQRCEPRTILHPCYIETMTPALDLRYPIGPFKFGLPVSFADRPLYLTQLAEAPAKLRAAVAGLSGPQLDTPYRPEGWTVRQVVHQLADAHVNWYIRPKLAVTETEPTIKPYDEALWAQLPDARTGPIEPSLMMFEGMRARPLGVVLPIAHTRRVVATIHASGVGRALRGRHASRHGLALAPSHGAHHRAAPAHGLVSWKHRDLQRIGPRARSRRLSQDAREGIDSLLRQGGMAPAYPSRLPWK